MAGSALENRPENKPSSSWKIDARRAAFGLGSDGPLCHKIALVNLRFLLLVVLTSAAGALLAGEPPSAPGPFSLTDKNFGARPWLADHGLTFTGSYTAEVLGNVRGGLATGATFNGLVQFTAEADLEKLVTWHGATLHAAALHPHGPSLSGRYTGDFAVVSNIDAYDSFRLYEAWLEQLAFDGRFALRVGFLASDAEFFNIGTAAPFINSSFGTANVLSANFPLSSYPYSALGLRLRLIPAPGWSLQLGAYDGNPAPGVLSDPTPGAAPSNEFNRHGIRFALRRDEGAILFAELAWRHGDSETKDGPAPLSGIFKLGATYHTDTFGDIHDLTLADIAPLSSHTKARSVRGNYAIYAIAEHELWREPGTAHDGLGAFARVAFAPPGRNFISSSAEAGLVYRGLLQRDAADTLGLGFAWLGLSPEVRAAHHSAHDPAPSDEASIELTYQYAMTPWWTLQPDAQWIFHPSGIHRDALVIGLRTTVTF